MQLAAHRAEFASHACRGIAGVHAGSLKAQNPSLQPTHYITRL